MTEALTFAQTGVHHVERFFPKAELISLTATARDGQPIRTPLLLSHVNLRFLSEPGIPSRDKLLSVSSILGGIWGEVEILGRASYSLTPYRIFDSTQPPMIDLIEAHRTISAAGHDFYFSKVVLERPLFKETEEEFWWFYSISDPIKVGCGARTGRVVVVGANDNADADSEGVAEEDIIAQERATLNNINEAIRIVRARYPGSKLLSIKALGKQFAPVTEAVKFHLTFQYAAGWVDIFSKGIMGEWEVPIYTEGRRSGWQNVPYEATSRDFVVRAKL